MRKINPFLGLFVALATLMAAFFVPVFVILLDHGERLAAIEATVADHGDRLARVEIAIVAVNERLTRVEATQADHGERFARIEARLDDLEDAVAALARDVAATNERMARIEGTVAGALGRPFPERMAEAPDNEPAPRGRGGVDG